MWGEFGKCARAHPQSKVPQGWCGTRHLSSCILHVMVGMNGSDDDGETLGVICLCGMDMVVINGGNCGDGYVQCKWWWQKWWEQFMGSWWIAVVMNNSGDVSADGASGSDKNLWGGGWASFPSYSGHDYDGSRWTVVGVVGVWLIDVSGNGYEELTIKVVVSDGDHWGLVMVLSLMLVQWQ